MKLRVGIILVSLLGLALVGGSILLWRLFVLSFLVLLAGLLWSRFSLRGVTAQSKISSRYCQVGESFEEEITLFNHSRLPKLLIKLKEGSDFPGHHSDSIVNLTPKGVHDWRFQVHCQKRGRFCLGTFSVTATDPFGFFFSQRRFGELQGVTVFPATLELPNFRVLSGDESGYGPGRWAVAQTTPNAARIREYTAGDSLSRIHWHSTAHTSKLMVKVFDPDRSDYASKDIWVITDMHRTAHIGDGADNTEECSVTIAASLIKKFVDSGKQAGLMVSDTQPYIFSPQTGSAHLRRMLEVLAVVKAQGEVAISELIAGNKDKFGSNSVVLVITPSGDGRLIGALHRLKNQGNVPLVVLLDSFSFGGGVSAVPLVSRLTSSGIPSYIVRRGDDLATALDDRVAFSSLL